MPFEIINDIHDVENIAVNTSMRDLDRLRRTYGRGRWRKMKGVALIQLTNGRVREAELH